MVYAESSNSVSEDAKSLTGLGKKFSNIHVHSSTNTNQSEQGHEDQNYHDLGGSYPSNVDLVEGLLSNTKNGYQQRNDWAANTDNLLDQAPLLYNNGRGDLYRDPFESDDTNPELLTLQNRLQSQPYSVDFNDFFMNDNTNPGLKMQDQRLETDNTKLFDF